MRQHQVHYHSMQGRSSSLQSKFWRMRSCRRLRISRPERIRHRNWRLRWEHAEFHSCKSVDLRSRPVRTFERHEPSPPPPGTRDYWPGNCPLPRHPQHRSCHRWCRCRRSSRRRWSRRPPRPPSRSLGSLRCRMRELPSLGQISVIQVGISDSRSDFSLWME